MTKPHFASHVVAPEVHESSRAMRAKQDQIPESGVWDPSVVQRSSKQAHTTRPVAIPIEQALIDVISRPIGAEGHRDGNDRKEHEIASLFDTLTPIQSLTLNRRLISSIPGDLLATAFKRLVVERRIRLLDYLARQRAIAITRSA